MNKLTLDELSPGLIQYLQGLGMSEETVKSITGDPNALQTSDKRDLVAAINEVNGGQKHKLTENSGYAINGAVDCNDIKKCGTYMGSNMKNTPLDSAMWFFIKVDAHNDIWCRQEAIPFTDINFGKYERYLLNGVWSEWRSL